MYRLHQIDDWASLIIRMTLEEMGVEYELKRHDFDAGTLDRPGFRALNPQGLIPVLETDGGPIFETAAILLWLADRHGRMAPGPAAPARGAFLSWFMFTANSLHPTVLALIHPERISGPIGEGPVCQSALARLHRHCALLETLLEADPDWLGMPSVLTPYLAVLLRWGQMLAADPTCNLDLTGYPALVAHLRAFEARPAVARTTLAEALGLTPFSNPQE